MRHIGFDSLEQFQLVYEAYEAYVKYNLCPV